MKTIITLLFSFYSLTAIAATILPSPLVETEWLSENMNKVTILDVRKDTKSFTSKPIFKKDKKTKKPKLSKVGGHIPGALLVNYKKVRVTREISGKKVTRIVPTKLDFENLMQKVGLNKDDAIVVVSKGASNSDVTMASRLYWQLKYFGHKQIAILNGGMAQWIVDKRKISKKTGKAKKGNWVATTQNEAILATSKDVANAVKAKNAQLVDTRTMSLYLGTWNKSYVYGKGHIPGAKVYPNELMTTSKMPVKFITKSDTENLLKAMNINAGSKTITYCNSGHLASGTWFLMHEILENKQVKLYDGSMHQWTLEKNPTTSMKME